MARTIVIKRYGNRRLYNSETRSYVKLQDIAGFIRGGAEIQVLDSRTGEDLTKLVLTQIILDEEKSKKDLLPLSFLYDLIRHQQGWVQEFFQRHVGRALEGVLPSRGELLNQLRHSLDFRTSPTALLDRLLRRGESAEKGSILGDAVQEPPAISGNGADAVPGTPLDVGSTELAKTEIELDQARDPLEELLQRLDTMEARMSRIEANLNASNS
jgi:polyhydroxyalkanoate synthesis repressor PhaR